MLKKSVRKAIETMEPSGLVPVSYAIKEGHKHVWQTAMSGHGLVIENCDSCTSYRATFLPDYGVTTNVALYSALVELKGLGRAPARLPAAVKKAYRGRR